MKMCKCILVVCILLIAACSSIQNTENKLNAAELNNNEFPESKNTVLDHPPTDVDRFNEVKREIDYWYNKPPRSIGSQHKMQMMNRLAPLNIDPATKEEYIQKLNSILLVDDPMYLEQEPQQPQAESNALSSEQQSDQHVLRYCNGSGTVLFTSPPAHIEDLGFIMPMGVMTGHHVTPTDHGYITSNKWTNPGAKREDNVDKFVDVLAPADGMVIGVDRMPSDFATSTLGDYHITIYHTCTFYTIFIHVNEISEKLKTILETRVPASVKAGEVIGRSPGFDFSVFNKNVTRNVVNLESYKDVLSMLNADEFLSYFVEPIKTQLLEKNIRKANPLSGKMDYDIDGKLSGNWFVEDTNGYAGLPEYNKLLGYWTTHLAFVYNPIDPTIIIVSMGDYNDKTANYAVKGNAPDFGDVTPEDGLVKYELVKYDYLNNGKVWDEGHYAELVVQPQNVVEGTALVQMLEDRKIKFESFPGKKASQVSGFTENAKVYVR